MNQSTVYLNDILESIEKIGHYLDGMRDILIHEYAGVQIERVWRTTKDDLPPLKQAILELIK